MRKTLFFLLATVVLIAGPAFAQTSIPAGGAEVTWSGNCNESVSLKNDTNRPICDFRIIKTSGSSATTFPRDIVVEDGIGAWRVDDDENGTIDPAENDTEDSSPSSPARTAKNPGGGAGNPAGRCIPKGGTFGVTMCGDDTGTPADDNSNLNGYKFMIKPTAESGSDIVAAVNIDGAHTMALAGEFASNPFGAYSVFLVNDQQPCLDRISVVSETPGAVIGTVESSHDGRFDASSGDLVLSEPLGYGEGITLTVMFDRMSEAATTVLTISPLISSQATTPIAVKYRPAEASKALTFLGKVWTVDPSPGIWTGRIATYQRVTYEVLDIYEGFFSGRFVTIHHPLLMHSPDVSTSSVELASSVFIPGKQFWVGAEQIPEPKYGAMGWKIYVGDRLPAGPRSEQANCVDELTTLAAQACVQPGFVQALQGVLQDADLARSTSEVEIAGQKLEALAKAVIEQDGLSEKTAARSAVLIEAADRCLESRSKPTLR